MRELKFRAWTGRGFVHFDVREDNDFDFCNFYSWCEEDTIEQYTGLNDKFGRAIYEGDIVKGSWLYGKNEHVVKYEGCGFYPFVVTDFDGDPMVRSVDVEVIGNIHENQELLEEEE